MELIDGGLSSILVVLTVFSLIALVVATTQRQTTIIMMPDEPCEYKSGSLGCLFPVFVVIAFLTLLVVSVILR